MTTENLQLGLPGRTGRSVPGATARRLAALELAKQVRSKRAEAKHSLKKMNRQEATEAAIRLMEHPPSWAATWRINLLVQALPMWGPLKTSRLVKYLGITEGVTIKTITPGQLEALTSALRKIVYDQSDRPIGIGRGTEPAPFGHITGSRFI